MELAKERNIDYKPSVESAIQLSDYIDRKGIPSPLTDNQMIATPPVYNPTQQNNFPPGPGGPDNGFNAGGNLPPFMPPGGGMPPGFGLPQYMPPPPNNMPPPGQYPGYMP